MIRTIKTWGSALFALGAAAVLAGTACAQYIGGDLGLTLDQDNDVRFLAGDASLTGRVGGDVEGMAADIFVDAEIGGNVSLLGSDITIDGSVAGNVSVAGADLVLGARIGGDLDAAGADIAISSAISGDASIAGAIITIGQGASIGQDAELAAREVRLAGVIGGELDIRAREVRIAGEIAGPVNIRAEELVFEADAVILGPVSVRGPNEPVVMEGAQLARPLQYEFAPFRDENFGDFDGVDLNFGFGPPGWALGGAFAMSAFILGALAALIAPRSIGGIAATFRRRPFVSGLLGLILLAFSPVLLVLMFALLLVTVIGIPLAFILVLAYPVALFLAFAFGGLAIGDIVFNRSGSGIGVGMRILSLFLVLAILGALTVVPLIGWLIGAVVLCIGLGAWTIAIFSRPNANGSAPAPAAAQPDGAV